MNAYKVWSSTLVLAEHAANSRFSDLPEKVLDMAKPLILDSMANMIGGASLTQGETVIKYIRDQNDQDS